MNGISHTISVLIIYEYAKHMKDLQVLNNAPHCSGGKSYARITHEDI